MGRAPKRPASSANDDDPARPPRKSRLGVRSCDNCHQRKVRCDRGVPCTNCSRYDMTCVYPTRDLDAARTTPSLRDISTCLKRLEILLSRFAESSDATIDDGDGRTGSEMQIQARPVANVNAIDSSDRRPNKSTWEILLNNSDSEPLLQDVSLDLFLRFSLSTKIRPS
jgi:hypothetical protein